MVPYRVIPNFNSHIPHLSTALFLSVEDLCEANISLSSLHHHTQIVIKRVKAFSSSRREMCMHWWIFYQHPVHWLINNKIMLQE